MSGGIRHIRIENSTLSGNQNCIFIKSRDGRGGYMEDITGDHLIVKKSPTFIGIDLVTKGIQASDPVTGVPDKWARVGGIKFTHVQVEGVADLILGKAISPERPIDGFVLADITGTCAKGITLANVNHADFSGINVTGYTGPLLNLTNVQGTGLENPR
jgi:polygalacturonase